MIEGALILFAGIVMGRLLPSRRRTPRAVTAKCGCRHHLSMHDTKTGACHGTGEWNPRRSQHDQCTCRQYVGPRPVEDFFSTPMLPPRDS